MPSFMKLLFIFVVLIENAFSISTWHHKQYENDELNQKYTEITNLYSDNDFKLIFSDANLSEELQVLRLLKKIKTKDLEFAVLYAAKLDLINDIEVEILVDQCSKLRKIRKYESKLTLRLKKGSKRFESLFDKFDDDNYPISKIWEDFQQIVVSSLNTKINIYSELNLIARRKRLISKRDYKLFEYFISKRSKNSLTISEYRQKKKALKDKGYVINESLTEFHLNNISEDSNSLRYKMYNKYNLLQQSKMLDLLIRFNNRSSTGSASIIFFDDNGTVNDRKDLDVVEQLHLSMKLYAVEKQKLSFDKNFKTTFNYKDLLTIAFETSQISRLDLDSLALLERKMVEKSKLQKALSYAERADFIATAIAGPLGGFIYTLTVGMANNIFNAPVQKATYDHSIFYGNCEMKL